MAKPKKSAKKTAKRGARKPAKKPAAKKRPVAKKATRRRVPRKVSPKLRGLAARDKRHAKTKAAKAKIESARKLITRIERARARKNPVRTQEGRVLRVESCRTDESARMLSKRARDPSAPKIKVHKDGTRCTTQSAEMRLSMRKSGKRAKPTRHRGARADAGGGILSRIRLPIGMQTTAMVPD